MTDRQGVPYDRGWAWMVVVGYFFSAFIMVGVGKSYGILMKPLMEEFHVDVTIASLGMAVSGAVYTITAPIFVTLGQHFTERVIVIFGAIFGCCVISLCYFKFSIGYLIALYGIGAGIGNACLFGNGLVMIGNYFKRIRTIANGVALSGASVGTFAVPPLMEYLLQLYGLSGTYLILGGLYLMVAVSGALYRPVKFYTKNSLKRDDKHQLLNKGQSDSTQNGQTSKEDPTITTFNCDEKNDPLLNAEKELESEEIEDEKLMSYISSTGSLVLGSVESLAQVVQAEEIKQPTRQNTVRICGKDIPKIFHFFVLKMPVVQFYTLFSFLVFFGYFNFVIFMPLDAVSRGYESFEKAWLVSCAGIGDLVGRIVVGLIGDLTIIERYKIIGAACICCGLNILIFNFATVFWWCAIHTTLYGFFGGAYVALTSIVLIDMVGLDIMPKALGVILLIQGFGAAIGQPIEGSIRDFAGSYSPLNILNSSLMIIGGSIMFLYPLVRDFKKKQNQNGTASV